MVFRIQKTGRYTVMSNYHFSDKNLSLKSKGLLSQMLSLPECWDFSLRGLAAINREGIDAIRTAILELEINGYIVRHQGKDESGKFLKIIYDVYEIPMSSSPLLENPNTEGKPCLENPNTVNVNTENPTQLNTYPTKDVKTNSLKEQPLKSINHINQSKEKSSDKIDLIDEIESCRQQIRENLEYDVLVEQYQEERLDGIIELIVETISSTRKNIRVSSDNLPAPLVKDRLLQLRPKHMEYVFNCLDNTSSNVKNIKNYVLTALFNAPVTLDAYYRAEINHDMETSLKAANDEMLREANKMLNELIPEATLL